MYNVIQSELFKLKKLRTFKILFVFTMMITLLTVFIASATRDFWDSIDMPDVLSGINLYYATLGNTAIMVIAGVVLAGIFICNDFESKILQAAVSSGCSRLSVVLGKMAVYFLALAALLSPTVIITGAALLLMPELGMVFTSEILLHMAAVFAVMLLIYTASLSICIPLSFAVKRSSVVIVLGIVALFFGVDMISGIGELIPWIGTVLSWLPFTLPGTVLVSGVSPAVLLKAAGVSIGFILLMTAAAYGVFRRMDLK